MHEKQYEKECCGKCAAEVTMERALGRQFNLKFSVNPKQPTNLSEFVKTRDREKLFWVATMNASMRLFMTYLHFFLSLSAMLTNVGMIALSGMTLSLRKKGFYQNFLRFFKLQI